MNNGFNDDNDEMQSLKKQPNYKTYIIDLNKLFGGKK